MQARAHFIWKKVTFHSQMRNFQFSIFNFQLKIVPLHRNLEKNGLLAKK